MIQHPRRPTDDASARLGRARWRGEPHRLEVWYATFTDPATGDGYWLHHEVVADAGGRAHGLGWLVAFPVDGQPVRRHFGPEPVSPVGASTSSWFSAGGARVGPGRLVGELDETRWDLVFEDDHPPLFTFPEHVWHGGGLPSAQVVPWPTASFSGCLTIAGRTVQVDRARGAVSRIYGRGNAHRWGWLHADLGDGEVLEIVAAQGRTPLLRRVPPKVCAQLRLDGVDWPSDPLAGAMCSRTRLELPRWYATVTSPRQRLRVGVRIPPSASATLDYRDPDATTARCTNSCRADAQIRLERRTRTGWAQQRSWSLQGEVHAEVGQRP